jgi:TOBE domain
MQVIVQLPEGRVVQAMIPNRGEEHGFAQGTSVTLHLPPDDLRVLAVDGGEVAYQDEGSQPAAAS